MGLGPGAEWRLLVGGERQVLAAVKPTSHGRAVGEGGTTHRQTEWPATVGLRFLESVSESISTEMLILRKWREMFGNQCI